MNKLLKYALIVGGAFLGYKILKSKLASQRLEEASRGDESRLDNTAVDDPYAVMLRAMAYPYYPFKSFEEASKEFPQNISP